MSKKPEYFASKLNGFVALGPVATMKNINSNMVDYAIHFNLDYAIYKVFNEVGKSRKGESRVIAFLCKHFYFACNGMASLISDKESDDNNPIKFGNWIAHWPSGTSVKNVRHFGDIYRSKSFAEFDYGKIGNLKRYSSIYPPRYKVENIKDVPTCIFFGDHDRLSTYKDNVILMDQLNQNQNVKKFKMTREMGHLTWMCPNNDEHLSDIFSCVDLFHSKDSSN